jgi:hypothetical protein
MLSQAKTLAPLKFLLFLLDTFILPSAGKLLPFILILDTLISILDTFILPSAGKLLS